MRKKRIWEVEIDNIVKRAYDELDNRITQGFDWVTIDNAYEFDGNVERGDIKKTIHITCGTTLDVIVEDEFNKDVTYKYPNIAKAIKDALPDAEYVWKNIHDSEQEALEQMAECRANGWVYAGTGIRSSFNSLM